jgi:hypothetical protein
MKISRTVLLLMAALWISTTSAAGPGPAIVGEGRNLQVQEFRVEAAPTGIGQVVGIARNLGSTALANVFIEVNLYDERGVLVGNTIAHGMNLAAGGWWKFSAPTTTRFHHAEIAKITAYQ